MIFIFMYGNITEDGNYKKVKFTTIVVTKKRMFSISENGLIIEGTDVLSIGSGKDSALAMYREIKHNKISCKDKILKCLDAAIKSSANICYPVI